MFGYSAKIGLKSSVLPILIINKLKTEEDLEATITSINTGNHFEVDETLIEEKYEEEKIDKRINKITANNGLTFFDYNILKSNDQFDPVVSYGYITDSYNFKSASIYFMKHALYSCRHIL
ncbi:hypothetical protein QTP88_006970 [Uroleucon formosanum]